MQVFHDNIGAWDGALRWLASLIVLAVTSALLGSAGVDAKLSIGLGGYLLMAYLMLTAYVRVDPLYVILQWSTVGGGHREYAPGAARPSR